MFLILVGNVGEILVGNILLIEDSDELIVLKAVTLMLVKLVATAPLMFGIFVVRKSSLFHVFVIFFEALPLEVLA